MILFPAIDLKNGQCVRLEQGDMARATVFHRDPAAQAQAFEALGFEYLHVVDLDGAFAGKPVNVAAVERIIEATKIPLQLGGGIRDMANIEGWLGKGVDRVIIGTAAVRDPTLVRTAAKLHAEPDGLEDALDRGRVHRLAGESAVEIDHVEMAKARRLELVRLRGRIAVEHGRARHVALLEAHAYAVLEVDGGKEDHGAIIHLPRPEEA